MDTGSLLNRQYRLMERLGQGGMGTVYRAFDTFANNAPVAIKILKPELVSDTYLERFRREEEALRHITHPGVVKILNAFQEDNQQYIVMEYVAGGSLLELLERQKVLSLETALTITLELARTLQHIHACNVVHRDIKPGNVLLAEDGTPRLTDFGVAFLVDRTRVTQTGHIVGTEPYLSPETCYGFEPDDKADIWALGILLYEMLAGRRPFEGQIPGVIITAILTRAVPDITLFRPEISRELVELLNRMLEKDKAQRLGPASEVVKAISAIQGGMTGMASTPPKLLDSTFIASMPGATLKPPPSWSNLPEQNTPFVGREQEVGEIIELLQSPDCRLLTLLGPGGMGKTRLALEVARQTQGDFADGVCFVSLAGVTDRLYLLPAIAEGVRLTFRPGNSPKQQLLDYLQRRALLLVMDNFEQVLDETDLLCEILSAAPQIKLMTTSREALNLQEEWLYHVRGMAIPESSKVDHLETYGAVRLFLQSARRVRRSFSLDEEREPVLRILRLVGGMPLGIEIAAAWLKHLPCQRVADEIGRSLDFLTAQARNVTSRHRSIRAVFDYSWVLLSDEECDALMKMSVFRGGFTEEAATKVIGLSFWTLVALVDKSLLFLDDRGRYTVQLLLQQYAAEKLSASEREAAVRDAHSLYYTDFTYRQEQCIKGANQKPALDALRTDYENIRAALLRAAQKNDPAAIGKCLFGLFVFFETQSRQQEGAELLALALETLPPLDDTAPPDDRLIVRIRLSALEAFYVGDFNRAVALTRQTFAVIEENDLWADIGFTLSLLVFRAIGLKVVSGEKALELCRRVITASRESGDAFEQAVALSRLGRRLLMNLDAHSEAKVLLKESAALTESTGDGWLIGYISSALGDIARHEGDIAEARRLYEAAGRYAREMGDRIQAILSIEGLAQLAQFEGDYSTARRSYQAIIELCAEFGDALQSAWGYYALGVVCIAHGEYPEATQALEHASALFQEYNNPFATGWTLFYLCQIAILQGHFAEARLINERALSYFGEDENHWGFRDYTLYLGRLAHSEGHYAQAIQCFESVIPVYEADEDWVQVAYLHNHIGRAELGLKNTIAARTHFLYALNLLRIGALPVVLAGLGGMAKAASLEGDAATAISLARLVHQSPATEQEFKDEAAYLLTELASILPVEIYHGALVQGQRLDIETAVGQFKPAAEGS